MGTWSTALYGNDIAVDVRENYLHYLRSGLSNNKAAKQVLEDYDDELADPCEAFLVWSALAETQWKVGRLQTKVRDKALRMIKAGGDLQRWQEENTAAETGSRKRVLESLRKKLLSDPPPEKTLKPLQATKTSRPKAKSKARSEFKVDWKKGQLLTYHRTNGKLAILFVEGVLHDRQLGSRTYFSSLDWKGKNLPAADKLRSTELLLDAACLTTSESDPVPWDRIQVLSTKRRRRGQLYITKNSVGGITTSCTWRTIEEWLDEICDRSHQKYLQSLL